MESFFVFFSSRCPNANYAVKKLRALSKQCIFVCLSVVHSDDDARHERDGCDAHWKCTHTNIHTHVERNTSSKSLRLNVSIYNVHRLYISRLYMRTIAASTAAIAKGAWPSQYARGQPCFFSFLLNSSRASRLILHFVENREGQFYVRFSFRSMGKK